MWIVPTRNRQARCQRLMNALVESECTSPVLVVLDDCDYPGLTYPDNVTVHRMEEHTELCGILRWVFAEFPDEPFYGEIGDGHVPQTKHWDKRLEKAAGRRGVSSCNDLFNGKKGGRMGGGTCWGGDILRELGYWSPPGFVHLYIDAVWETIGETFDCWTYLDDVIVETMHVAAGKSAADENNRRRFQDEDFGVKDRQRFQRWRDDFLANR